jgi:hypothetical protein
LDEDTNSKIDLAQIASRQSIRFLELDKKLIDATIALNNRRGYVDKAEAKKEAEKRKKSIEIFKSSEKEAYEIVFMYKLAALNQAELFYRECVANTQNIVVRKEALKRLQRFKPSKIKMDEIARNEYEQYVHWYKISTKNNDYNGARKHLGQSLLWIRLISKLSDGKSSYASPEAIDKVYKEWNEKFLDK